MEKFIFCRSSDSRRRRIFWILELPRQPSDWGHREARSHPLPCGHTHRQTVVSSLHPSHAQARVHSSSQGRGTLWVGTLLHPTPPLAAFPEPADSISVMQAGKPWPREVCGMSTRAGDRWKSTAGGGLWATLGLVASQDLSVSKTACHRVGSDRPAAHLSSTLGKLLNRSEL